jgi:hypothetical protein
MRVNSNGLPHLEQGGRSLSTNLKFGGWAIACDPAPLLAEIASRFRSANLGKWRRRQVRMGMAHWSAV